MSMPKFNPFASETITSPVGHNVLSITGPDSVLIPDQGAHRILKIKFPDISLIFPEHSQNFPWWKWHFWTYIPRANTSHVLLLIMKTIQKMQKWLTDMDMDNIKVHSCDCAKPKQILNNFNSNHKTALNFYHWFTLWNWKKSMKYLFQITQPNNSVQDLLDTLANTFILPAYAKQHYWLFNRTGPTWTHLGLVTPYNNNYLGQHWIKWCLVARWHQAITCTNVDLRILTYIQSSFTGK